jgi:hypothetical protein
MAEQLNSKLAVTEQAGDSVDLDNLFAFLSEVQPNRNQIIDEIGERMNELVEDLDVEVCIWIITCQYGKILLYLQSIYKLLLIQEVQINASFEISEPIFANVIYCLFQTNNSSWFLFFAVISS